jgi:hypothetical protein
MQFVRWIEGPWMPTGGNCMSSKPQIPGDGHRSARRVALDIFLIVAIPTVVIYIISKVWK